MRRERARPPLRRCQVWVVQEGEYGGNPLSGPCHNDAQWAARNAADLKGGSCFLSAYRTIWKELRTRGTIGCATISRRGCVGQSRYRGWGNHEPGHCGGAARAVTRSGNEFRYMSIVTTWALSSRDCSFNHFCLRSSSSCRGFCSSLSVTFFSIFKRAGYQRELGT
jgi:hypothetical protein